VPTDLAIRDVLISFDQPSAVRGARELFEKISVRAARRFASRSAFKKVGNRYFEDVGNLMQPTGHPIEPVLVFLDLLKGQAHRIDSTLGVANYAGKNCSMAPVTGRMSLYGRAYLYIGLLVIICAALAIFAILKTPETKNTDLVGLSSPAE